MVGKVNDCKKFKKSLTLHGRKFIIVFRGAFKIQSNIYDEPFLRKWLTAKSRSKYDSSINR